MNQPLPSVSSLLSRAYMGVKTHFKTLASIIVWMWGVILLQQVILYVRFGELANLYSKGGKARDFYGNADNFDQVSDGLAININKITEFNTWAISLTVLTLIPLVWIGIRLVRAILALDKGQTIEKNEMRNAWKYLLPSLWISILSAIGIGIGLFLLIIPGIWLGVAISFASYLMFEENVRGVAALKASMALVKGRWWSVVWRYVACGIVFSVCAVIAIGIPQVILTALRLPSPIVTAVTQAISYFIFVPLQLFFTIQLFHDLKKTKASV